MKNFNPIILELKTSKLREGKVINLCNFIFEAHKRNGANTRKMSIRLLLPVQKPTLGKDCVV